MDAGTIQRRDDEWTDERQKMLGLSHRAGQEHGQDQAAQVRIAAVLGRPRNWLTVEEFCKRGGIVLPDA